MGQVCLSEPRCGLNEFRTVSKFKLGLPRVIMGFDKSLNQNLQSGSKKISYMSSNGSLGNYYGALKVNLKTCDKGTKWKVYNYLFFFSP